MMVTSHREGSELKKTVENPENISVPVGNLIYLTLHSILTLSRNTMER